MGLMLPSSDRFALGVAAFRTKQLLRERCPSTCPRRRRAGQARHTQGGLQIRNVRDGNRVRGRAVIVAPEREGLRAL
jgi:hypothetical protein